MQSWVKYPVRDPFVPFGAVHFWTFLVFMLGVVAIYLFREQLRSPRANAVMRYSLLTGLIVGEGYWYVWKTLVDKFDVAVDLPLQLCSISTYLSIYLLLSRRRFLFDFVYYFAIAGASVAIITPELTHNFPHIHYWGYMLQHAALVYTSFFLLWVEEWHPTSRSLLRALVGLNLVFGFVFLMNLLTGGNYMYVMHKPHSPTLIDYLGPHPWYILSLEGVVMVICGLMYLPFFLKDRKVAREKQAESNLPLSA